MPSLTSEGAGRAPAHTWFPSLDLIFLTHKMRMWDLQGAVPGPLRPWC